jgi:gamma-glutamyltranspeptidase / glutathione hydrolase
MMGSGLSKERLPRKPMQGAIAAGHPKTVEAGLEMLRLGGNAIDAVLAALLTACVVEPLLTSPAGGGFCLVQSAGQPAQLFDFFTQTPLLRPEGNLDFYPVSVDFGGASQEFHIGLGAVAVPGLLAGIEALQQHYSRLPLSVLIEPAVAAARQGIEIIPFMAYCLRLLAPIVEATPSARQIYAPAGLLLQQADLFRNPDLADFLEAFAQEGAACFYQGEPARAIAQLCHDQGGLLRRADLESYRVIVRDPLQHRWRNWSFSTNPPPSAGGLMMTRALQDLEGAADPLAAPTLVRSLRHLEALRRDHLDERLHEPEITTEFLKQSSCKWGSTTHISAVDAQGNAASLTSSNGEGCGTVLSGTGIHLNNMLGEADLNPRGFHRWPPNRRQSSMMAPSLLRTSDQVIVLGSGGSNRIRTAILQVALRAALGQDLQQAVTAPRLHWEAERLDWEPGWNAAAISQAACPGETIQAWQAPNMFFGGVHAVRLSQGQLSGMGDPRRNGAFGVI